MQAGFLFFVCRTLYNYKKTKGKNGTFIKKWEKCTKQVEKYTEEGK